MAIQGRKKNVHDTLEQPSVREGEPARRESTDVCIFATRKRGGMGTRPLAASADRELTRLLGKGWGSEGPTMLGGEERWGILLSALSQPKSTQNTRGKGPSV